MMPTMTTAVVPYQTATGVPYTPPPAPPVYRSALVADAVWLAALVLVIAAAVMLGKFSLRNYLTFIVVAVCIAVAAGRLAYALGTTFPLYAAPCIVTV